MRALYLFCFICVLTSCAHLKKDSSQDSSVAPASVDSNGNPVQAEGEVVVTQLKEMGDFHLSGPKPEPVKVAELEEPVPESMQPMVDKWVNYFQGRGREHMERYLARSTRYLPLMKKILTDSGMPEDLVYISLIESGFNYKAASWASAVGYWQFIRPTGRRYGLEVNSLVDERRDPVLATQAAAAYYKDLYEQFGSWYLAMASYNVGEGRVARETARLYTNNFWDLVKKKRLPRETMNYVPKFIAARMIAKNPEQYGFVDIDYMDPIEFDHITVEKAVNLKALAEKMGLEYDDLKQLNPKFRGEVAPLKGSNLTLRVPVGQQQLAVANIGECFVDKVEFVADAGEIKWYKIRSGDTLSRIAKKFRTTVAVLRDMNNINRKKMIRVGRRIMVPDRSGGKTSRVASVEKTVNAAVKAIIPTAVASESETSTTDDSKIEEMTSNGHVYYFVQPGDTLSVIADRYNTNVASIRRMNDFSKRTVLKAGTRIQVPKSLKDRDSGEEDDNRHVAASSKSKAEAAPLAAVSVDADGVSHTVRPGENLTLIAKKYGVSVSSIKKANNLSRRAVLRAGLKLVIPTSNDKPNSSSQMRKKNRVHIVKRGENLHYIARKYGVELSDIKTKNKRVANHSKLYVGARLLIPSANAKE